MSLKKIIKNTLGSNYHKFRLKYILTKLFGNNYLSVRKYIKSITVKLSFIKNKLNKKVEHQRIVKNESGFLIDFTKDNYLSYHLRPKNSKNFNLESSCTIDEKIAIIIQGPIKEKFNFLKDTINIYKKIFKNSIIIISTWENENINLINSLVDTNIYVLFNKEPLPSRSNVDHQIISTNKGLNLAIQKKAKYALKTRADVRISKNNLETFLISLTQIFPVKKNGIINSRIIVPSLMTFKYRLFSLSDIVMFGETNDLLKYFDSELYEDSLIKFGIKNKDLLINKNILNNGTPLIAEIFLCSRLIKKIDDSMNWSLENWWNSLKDYFCIIDNSSLDLFWYKYDWEYEYRYLRTYSDKFARAVDFQDWLSLYNGCQNNWHLATKEHEVYDESLSLTNIFKK